MLTVPTTTCCFSLFWRTVRVTSGCQWAHSAGAAAPLPSLKDLLLRLQDRRVMKQVLVSQKWTSFLCSQVLVYTWGLNKCWACHRALGQILTNTANDQFLIQVFNHPWYLTTLISNKNKFTLFIGARYYRAWQSVVCRDFKGPFIISSCPWSIIHLNDSVWFPIFWEFQQKLSQYFVVFSAIKFYPPKS